MQPMTKEDKVDTKVVLIYENGKKVKTLLPRKFADVLLDQIDDPIYDGIKTVKLSNIEAGNQDG